MSHARRLSCLKQCLLKFSAKSCLKLESTQPIKHHIMNLTRPNSRSQAYFKGESQLPVTLAKNQFRTTIITYTRTSATFSHNISRFFLHQKALPLASMTHLLIHRSYSLSLHNSTDISDWADELPPYVQELLDSQIFLVTSVGSTLIAWILMPLILRKLHQYSIMQSPTATTLAYEKTFWGALEDPVRYLVTFVALSHICVMEAPIDEALQNLAEGWKGVAIFSFTWFLQRWKTNILENILSSQSFNGQGQQHKPEHNASGQSFNWQGQQQKLLKLSNLSPQKLLKLNSLSSAAIFGVGSIMALAAVGGVSLGSVSVGSVEGGVIAFAARYVFADVYSGFMLHLEPFTIGDTIKAGQIEGEVKEIGVTKTVLVDCEKNEVVVPNSYLCKQVIVIKRRREHYGMMCKIPLRIEAVHRIGKISYEINRMLSTNANVCMEKGAPCCYLSSTETSQAELTLGYNLKLMGEVEMYLAERDIREKAMEILKRHNASLSCSSSESESDSDSDSDKCITSFHFYHACNIQIFISTLQWEASEFFGLLCKL